MRATSIALVLTLVLAADAQAVVLLDQQHMFDSSIADSTNGNVSELGQTFTVGIAGTLDHIDVFMFRLGGIFDPTGDPVLRVYNTAGGLPSGAALASVSVPEALVPLGNPGFVTFDVSGAGLPVNVGDVLAFGISTSSEVGPYFLPNDADTGAVGDYTTGAAFRRIINPVGPWQALTPPQDHGFKTFVNAVPEPSTFALAALAVAGIGMAARRKKTPRRA